MAKEPRVNFTTGMQNSQSVQPKVVSTPPPPDPATKDPVGSKYIFYCSHNNMNCTDGKGHFARFRHHVFRTDDDEVAKMVTEQFAREDATLVIKKVSESELETLLTAVNPGPPATFEPIPDQGQDKPNPDFVSAAGAEGVAVVTDADLKEKANAEASKEGQQEKAASTKSV